MHVPAGFFVIFLRIFPAMPPRSGAHPMASADNVSATMTKNHILKCILALLHDLRPAAVSATILVATSLALTAGFTLPASLTGLRTLAPWMLLLACVALAFWFNRGRTLIVALSLLAAYASYGPLLIADPDGAGARAVLLGIAVIVPFNIGFAAATAERGVLQLRHYRWLLLFVIEALLVFWLAGLGDKGHSGTAWVALLDNWLFKSPPMPVAGRLMFAAALAATLIRAWPKPPATLPLPLNAGNVGALIAFFMACEWAASPGAFGAFMAGAGAILLVALLQESHRLAFRDELTGLPGRRALDERLRSLGSKYALAMIDVDHFKKFNDTHGHGIGDQVLKLVAVRLTEVGGGTAYRYGGEEFAVVFADSTADEARPHIEAMRAAIEGYRMALRRPDRPRNPKEGTALRHTQPPAQNESMSLSVTISAGVAQPDEKNTSPGAVLKAADQALYRAKQAGRNRVSA